MKRQGAQRESFVVGSELSTDEIHPTRDVYMNVSHIYIALVKCQFSCLDLVTLHTHTHLNPVYYFMTPVS